MEIFSNLKTHSFLKVTGLFDDCFYLVYKIHCFIVICVTHIGHIRSKLDYLFVEIPDLLYKGNKE